MLRARCASSLTAVGVCVVPGSTLTGFLVVRGVFERSRPEWNLTYKNLFVPLTLAALPSVGYAVAKKTAPPEAASVGLILCVLHHTYDRMLALQHYNGWRGKPY